MTERSDEFIRAFTLKQRKVSEPRTLSRFELLVFNRCLC
jgi:hypothetical protein